MKAVYIGVQNIFGNINTGGTQCSQKNYELLRQIIGKDNICTLLVVNRNNDKENNIYYIKRVKNNLEALFANLSLNKYYFFKEIFAIKSYIEDWKPDFIFLDSSNIGKLSKIFYGKYKTICFFHNIESDYTKNKIKREGWQYFSSYLTSYYNEKMAVKYANKIIVLNDRDKKLLYKKYGRQAECKLPICFKDRFSINRIDKIKIEKNLLFVGSNFPPNYEGIKWFVNEVMIKLPDYSLTIVGKDFENEKKELERTNVKIVGTVDSLDEYYYHFSCLVIPILYGAGMKVKTAEAMMFGKTIFASKEALEGYEVDGVVGIYRCNSADEFIYNIRNAFQENKVNKYNKTVRNTYIEKYSFDRQLKLFQEQIVEQMKEHL